MSYLTEEEKKMPNDMKLLQYVLGIQSCKTKGEVVEILEDIQQEALEKKRKQVEWLIGNIITSQLLELADKELLTMRIKKAFPDLYHPLKKPEPKTIDKNPAWDIGEVKG